MVTLSRPFKSKVSQILAPVVSPMPFELATGPNGVPERRPLPVGKGGGASFWRAGLVGGVGALAFEGVPELVELVLAIGTDAGFDGSESTSIGVGAAGVVE